MRCVSWRGSECLKDLFNVPIKKKIGKVFGSQERWRQEAGELNTDEKTLWSLQGYCTECFNLSL